jgi:hypothetical protein
MSSTQQIEFDLKINDSNRILVLVRNLLERDEFVRKEFDCDLFNQFECHHNANVNRHLKTAATAATNTTFSSTTLNELAAEGTKCTYCKFFQLLNDRAAQIQINSELYRQLVSKSDTQRHFVNARYKKCNYPVEQLEWSEFQPWRSAYGLVAFASCSNQAQLFDVVARFEKEKLKYKKTLVSAKLFVDFHKKHEMSEEYQKSLELAAKSDGDSIASVFELEEDDGSSSLSVFQDPLLAPDELEAKPELTGQNVDSNMVNEQELQTKLKAHEKDIVYLDFLFAKEGIDKIAVIVETEKAKVETAMRDMINNIFKKIAYQIRLLNANEDKQINYFSEYLKTPIEKQTNDASVSMPNGMSGSASLRTTTNSSVQTQSSLLSIKLINKKLVIGRMSKFKADLYLLLNIADSALINYSQAYNSGKKELDTVWCMSALEGICVASFVYLAEPAMLSATAINGSQSSAKLNQTDLSASSCNFRKKTMKHPSFDSILGSF